MQGEHMTSPTSTRNGTQKAVSAHLLAPTESLKHSKWTPKEKVEEKKWNLTLSGGITNPPEILNVFMPKSLEGIHSRLHEQTVASKSAIVESTRDDTELKYGFGSTFRSSTSSSDVRNLSTSMTLTPDRSAKKSNIPKISTPNSTKINSKTSEPIPKHITPKRTESTQTLTKNSTPKILDSTSASKTSLLRKTVSSPIVTKDVTPKKTESTLGLTKNVTPRKVESTVAPKDITPRHFESTILLKDTTLGKVESTSTSPKDITSTSADNESASTLPKDITPCVAESIPANNPKHEEISNESSLSVAALAVPKTDAITVKMETQNKVTIIPVKNTVVNMSKSEIDTSSRVKSKVAEIEMKVEKLVIEGSHNIIPLPLSRSAMNSARDISPDKVKPNFTTIPTTISANNNTVEKTTNGTESLSTIVDSVNNSQSINHKSTISMQIPSLPPLSEAVPPLSAKSYENIPESGRSDDDCSIVDEDIPVFDEDVS